MKKGQKNYIYSIWPSSIIILQALFETIVGTLYFIFSGLEMNQGPRKAQNSKKNSAGIAYKIITNNRFRSNHCCFLRHLMTNVDRFAIYSLSCSYSTYCQINFPFGLLFEMLMFQATYDIVDRKNTKEKNIYAWYISDIYIKQLCIILRILPLLHHSHKILHF